MQNQPRDAVAIVLAAGAGRRVGADEPKAFLTIGGRPILAVAVASAAAAPSVAAVVVAAPPGWEERALACVEGCEIPATVVTGGATRQASVRTALAAVDESAEIVVVHDAARPFAPPDLFDRVISAVSDECLGVVPAVPVTDTVKEVAGERIVATLDRGKLVLAQTPQAFDAPSLRLAHDGLTATGDVITDDAAALERHGMPVAVVPGDPGNLKITTLFDLAAADVRMGGGTARA